MQLLFEIRNLLMPFSFSDLGSFSADSITAFFITVSWIYAAISVVWFLLKLWHLSGNCSRIRKQTQDAVSVPETVQASRGLSAVWRDYRASFIYRLGELEKTPEDSNEYFGASRILDRCMDIRYWTMLPGIFVGWGILGTFVGLTYGVGSFDTGSTEAIRGSISQLLAGMNTAFATSIWGMLLSIAFNFVEKMAFGGVRRSAAKLIGHLDHIFKLSSAQEAQILKQQQQETIENCVAKSLADIFTLQEDGQETKPSHFLRDMLGESVKQSKSLGNFSADLANTIDSALDRSFSKTLGQLSSAIEMLREEKGKSTEELSVLIVDSLKEGMAEMMDSFQEVVSGSTQDQLRELSQMMVRSGEALEKVPHELHAVVGSFQEQVDHMHQNMNKATGESLDTASQVSEMISQTLETASLKLMNAAEKLEQSIGDSSGRMREESQHFAEAIAVQFQESANSIENLTEQVSRMVGETMGEASRSVNESASKLEESMAASMASLQDETGKIAELLGAQFQKSAQTWEGLSENVSSVITETLQGATEKLLESATHLEQSLASSSERMQEDTGKVAELLGSQFQQSAKTCEGLSENVSRVITETLQGATEKLLESATHLESSMSSSSSRVQEETGRVMENLGVSFQKGAENFGTLTDGFAQSLALLLKEHESSSKALSDVTSSLNLAMKEARNLQGGFQASAKDFTESLEQVRGMVGQVVTTTDGLRTAQSELVRSLGEFREGNGTLLNRHADVAVQMQQNLEGLRQLNDDYVTKFQVIEKGLQGVFGELSKGLGEYQGQVKTQLNDCLSDFSKSLGRAVEGLSGAVEEMDEALGKWAKLAREQDLVGTRR